MWSAATLYLFLAFQSNFYEQGLKALEEKRYDAAVESLTNAVAAEPTDYGAHFNLALAYSLSGKDAEAIPEYKKTLDLKPDLYPAQLNIAILLLKQKKADDAIPYLTAAAGQKPKEFRPNYYLGEALSESGQPEKAEPSYLAALAIDPKSAAAESGLARALLRQGKLADADPHFKKSADLDPKYRDGLLELAGAYVTAKQTDRAVEIYQQFPQDPGAQEQLGDLLLKAGRPSDAIPYFQAAVDKSPTEANQAALAVAYLKSNERDKALPILDRILAADPNNYDIRMLHGRVLRDERKLMPAAQEFAVAARLKPESVEAWSELSGVLVVAEDYPDALKALDRLAALHAEKPGHVFLRAISLDKMKQVKPALESYRRFLDMSKGESPDQEFQARQRARILENELNKR